MSELDPTAPYLLDCPPGYLDLSEIEKFTICNGCGRAGAKFDFIPQTVWGLDITEACYVHDYAYFLGESWADKERADRQFFNNMLVIIENKSNFLLRALRRRRALKYYEAVCELGGAAFWAGKQGVKQ
jgi:hypothetical protein